MCWRACVARGVKGWRLVFFSLLRADGGSVLNVGVEPNSNPKRFDQPQISEVKVKKDAETVIKSAESKAKMDQGLMVGLEGVH